MITVKISIASICAFLGGLFVTTPHRTPTCEVELWVHIANDILLAGYLAGGVAAALSAIVEAIATRWTATDNPARAEEGAVK